MAIFAFTGLMGAGKTFHLVRDVIIPGFINSRKIYTNIPLKIGNIESFTDVGIFGTTNFYQSIDGEFVRNLPKHQESLQGAMVILDEAHNYFYSAEAMWDKVMLQFLTYSRHHAIDVVLGTQNLDNVSRKIRDLVEVEWRFTGQSVKGRLGKNKYKLQKFLKNEETPHSTTMHGFDKEVFNYYDSMDPGVKKNFGIPESAIPEDHTLRKWLIITILMVFGVGLLVYNLLATYGQPLDEIEKNSKSIEKYVDPEKVKEKFGPIENINVTPGKFFRDQSGKMFKLNGEFNVIGVVKIGDQTLYHFRDLNNKVIRAYSKIHHFFSVGQSVIF